MLQSNVFFWVACPLPGKLARVGGHSRQPVLNPAMHKASDAGHIGPHGMRRCLSFSYNTRHLMPGILDRMACGVALALAIRGRAKCR